MIFGTALIKKTCQVLTLHGYPRYTNDLDIWIELYPENAVKMIKALDQFGFGSLGLQVEDFLETDQSIQLRVSS